jgi:outer membrane protein assembly factor BamB
MEFLEMKRFLFILTLGSVIVLAGCSTTYRAKVGNLTAAPDWPYYRGEASSPGAVSEGTFPGSLDVLWEHKSKDKPVGPMTIYYDHLIYPGGENKIRFIKLQDGQLTGAIKPKGQTQTGVVGRGNLVFFATGPRADVLRCVDVARSKKIWLRNLVDASSGMLIVNDMLIVGTGGGTLMALEPYNGDEIWRFASESKFNIPPTYANGVIYQPGDDGTLYALNPKDGVELFQVKLDGPLVSPVAVTDNIYATDMYGHVYSLDPDDGQENWRQTLSGPIWTSPAVSGGMLFVGHSGGEIVAMNAFNGEIVWSYKVVDVVRASPVVVGNFVIVGTLSGKLYSLRVSDGSVVDERDLGGAISASPVSDGSRVLVATDRGIITCFGAPILSDSDEK